MRKQRQDLADPTNWLTPAATKDIQAIKKRWDLPLTYLDFLVRFSPLKVYLLGRRFLAGLFLYGAGELIKAQDGYSYNPIAQQIIEDWPANLLVIAADNADPYALDLSKSDGIDAPILYAPSHMG